MARFQIRIDSSRSAADVFGYLARFSNAAEWDPGVAGAEELTPGPPEVGSTYRLRVRFAGRTMPLEYRIIEIQSPRRVVLQAENNYVRSTDTIEVSPNANGGSQMHYDAVLAPKGVFRIAAPFIRWTFNRVGKRAASGLRATLA